MPTHSTRSRSTPTSFVYFLSKLTKININLSPAKITHLRILKYEPFFYLPEICNFRDKRRVDVFSFFSFFLTILSRMRFFLLTSRCGQIWKKIYSYSSLTQFLQTYQILWRLRTVTGRFIEWNTKRRRRWRRTGTRVWFFTWLRYYTMRCTPRIYY